MTVRDASRPLAQSLRDEHHALRPHVVRLRELADAVGDISPTELRIRVADAHDFLTHQLIPHADGEERAFYPTVARLLHSREATRPMSWDHVEVVILTEALGALHKRLGFRRPAPDLARDLRRVLYGLYTLLTSHFAKEEELYLPVLERGVTPEEADAILLTLGAVAPSETARQ